MTTNTLSLPHEEAADSLETQPRNSFIQPGVEVENKLEKLKVGPLRDAGRKNGGLLGPAGLLALTILVALVLEPSPAQTINPGIIDPGNSFAGQTYSQWAAAFWQYMMGLPTTNNPWMYNTPHPQVPVNTGQAGPVWFLCGHYGNDQTVKTNAFTYSVPGGLGLFLCIEVIHADNANCPTDDTYSVAQLLATIRPLEDGVTNITCTIDGVPLLDLTNVLSSPYRIQAGLDFTCPATIHNFLYENEGLSCKTGGSGPIFVQGAAVEGVFLMISPLSAGSHEIHYANMWNGGQGLVLIQDATHYIAVEPAALAISGPDQTGNLVLSWPQTPDTYTLESNPILAPDGWQPLTNLPVVLTQATFQVTAPVVPTNQFFRLRMN